MFLPVGTQLAVVTLSAVTAGLRFLPKLTGATDNADIASFPMRPRQLAGKTNSQRDSQEPALRSG